jgi:hypothetical protein
VRHLIYVPAIGETIPPDAMYFELDVGAVVGVIVADDFETAGTILYDSLNAINDLTDPESTPYFDGFPIITDFSPVVLL